MGQRLSKLKPDAEIMKKGLTVVVIVLLICSIEAQAQFILSGEFRPRTEFSRGYKTLPSTGQDMSVATTQRTRLNALYSMEGIHTKLTLQDVRLWGSQPQMVTNEDFATSVHEAWAEINLNQTLSIRAGRQELVYDDHRIFGNVGWTQQARSHDLALLKIERSFKLHLGIAHHENSNITNNIYNGPDAYKNMQFLWFNKTWEKSALSLLLLNNGVPVLIAPDEEKSRYSQTIGGRITHSLDALNLAANLYGQTGKHNSGKNIHALNFLAEAALPNNITIGFEYLSGNSHDKTDKVYAFEPFYGTNHKFNGYMDYFYVGNHINSYGLHNGYIKYFFTKNKVKLDADIHYFATAGLISPQAKRYLGTELDLTCSWAIQPYASITGGWSVMFASENMEALRSGDRKQLPYWGYIMLTVTPAFIQ